MKIISYLSLTVSVLGACVIFICIIVWGVSLPQTALLWLNGPVSGWVELIIFALISTVFTLCPAMIAYDEITNDK